MFLAFTTDILFTITPQTKNSLSIFNFWPFLLLLRKEPWLESANLSSSPTFLGCRGEDLVKSLEFSKPNKMDILPYLLY